MESRRRPERPLGSRLCLSARPRRRPASAALLVLGLLGLSLGLSACGDDGGDGTVSDRKIVEALKLERLDGSYAVNGDPFCAVERELLNDADEVSEAEDRDRKDLVLSSRAGNVGVRVVPVFAPDCAGKARRALERLDPEGRRGETGGRKKRGGKGDRGKGGGEQGRSEGGGSGGGG